MARTHGAQGRHEPLRSTVELICAKLDSSLRVSSPHSEPWVLLSNIVDHEGRVYEAAKHKLVVSVAGIQHETTISTRSRTTPLKDRDDQFGVVAQPLYVNLLLLFVANFYDKNYADGLDMISRTISFFQQTPFFTHETLPDLDTTIDKITLEMVNLDLTQANYLMSMAGLKYLPAVLYRLRMIPFRSDDTITGVVAPARAPTLAQAPDAKPPDTP